MFPVFTRSVAPSLHICLKVSTLSPAGNNYCVKEAGAQTGVVGNIATYTEYIQRICSLWARKRLGVHVLPVWAVRRLGRRWRSNRQPWKGVPGRTPAQMPSRGSRDGLEARKEGLT